MLRIKKQKLLAILCQRFPELSKKQLYAMVLCGEVRCGQETLRNPKQILPVQVALQLKERRRYVSRGGAKLHKALQEFGPLGLDVQGATVLDAGASSGGFSDCLLQHGCAKVYAVDSGKNQLDYKLRCNPKVQSFEACKVQDFLQQFEESKCVLLPPDLAVMDISFRSILPLLAEVLELCQRHHGVFLCKPQFEWQTFCTRKPQYAQEVFSGVMYESLSYEVFSWFCQELQQQNIRILGHCPSPICGSKGNIEFLLFLQQG